MNLNFISLPKKAQCPTCLRAILITYDHYAQGLIYSLHSRTGSAKMEDRCENSLMPYESCFIDKTECFGIAAVPLNDNLPSPVKFFEDKLFFSIERAKIAIDHYRICCPDAELAIYRGTIEITERIP